LVGIDQIINNAAKMRQMTGGQFNVPIVFVVQQLRQTIRCNALTALENWFANTPGLKVVVPSTVYDAKGLLKAIRDNDPVILWNQNKCMVIRRSSRWRIYNSIGVADIKREGTDVTIVSLENYKEAHKAAEN
jgi:pyruvate dehydrogenase E1 component beta subunit